jgi:glycosyltransferase involved in cell wall biosynthesis
VAGQLSAGIQLRRVARRWRPDLVHLHSSFAGLVGSAALNRIAPLVYTPHGYSFIRERGPAPLGAMLRQAERRIARRVDLLGAVSDYEATLARGVGAPRVAVVPNGIPELDAPAEPTAKTDPPLVVAIGRIDPARRPIAAARILGGLRDLATPEWIGGGAPGSDRQALIDAGVHITGWLERPAVLERLARATACLHWSAWDAQPLSVLEAMSQDAIVVASDIPANRELLGGEQVRESEAEALELLRMILTDADLHGRLLAAQRARRARFGARRMVADWLVLYARVSAERRNGHFR